MITLTLSARFVSIDKELACCLCVGLSAAGVESKSRQSPMACGSRQCRAAAPPLYRFTLRRHSLCRSAQCSLTSGPMTDASVQSKRDVRPSIELAKFCVRVLVARENRPMKSSNHDTRPILSFARYQLASRIHNAECRSQNDTCVILFCI